MLDCLQLGQALKWMSIFIPKSGPPPKKKKKRKTTSPGRGTPLSGPQPSLHKSAIGAGPYDHSGAVLLASWQSVGG